MKTIDLVGAARTETGKKSAKDIRKAESIPAIIYGHDKNVLISINEKELGKVIYTPNVYVVNISVDGKAISTIVKEAQFHPVSDKIIHVDFLEVTDKKKVTVSLPIKLSGQSEGAKQGGKLFQAMRKVRVNGLVKNLPDHIDVDVTNLGLGKSIMVGDLNYDKFSIVEPKSLVIATIKSTRAARETQATEGAAK